MSCTAIRFQSHAGSIEAVLMPVIGVSPLFSFNPTLVRLRRHGFCQVAQYG